MLLQVISQSNADASEIQKFVSVDEDYYYIGSYGALVSPVSVWHKGATYITGTLDASTNNAPVILKWEDSTLEFNDSVGTIDNFDVLEHSHPSILIIDDYIYIFQVNGHDQDIKVWKSNSQEDISAFTLHHTILGDFNYCNPRLLDDGRVVILSREGYPDFTHQIAISAANDYTSWTLKDLTATDFVANDVRHYPSHPYMYGSNSWHYIGISLRDENTSPNGIETYFGQAIYKTQDFITFYSLDENFSKNIDVSGALTRSEIETNLMIVGTNAAQTTYVGPMQFIVVNDVCYSKYYDNTANYFKFLKVDTDGTITTYPCNIPNLDTTINFSYKFSMWYNGSNIVISTSLGIYAINLSLNNLQLKRLYTEDGEDNTPQAVSFPFNLDAVSGSYLFGGSTTEGVFPYYITSDKFLI